MSKIEEEVVEPAEEVTPDETEQNEAEPAVEQKSDSEEGVAPEVEEEENEVVVSIGDPAPETEDEKDPALVRHLRKTIKEVQHERRLAEQKIKEFEAKLQATVTENKPVQLGKKPTIEDFDYDAEKFEAALEGWFEKKNQAAREDQRRKEAEKAQADAWQEKLDNYGKLKAEIRVKDFEEAEHEILTVLSEVQQGIVLQGAENAALVVYALGKNPTKAREISKIADPVKFAFAIAKLEAQLKVTDKKPKPEPERIVSGAGKTSGSVDSTLDRLRAEAEKTGDYTKVNQYKKKLKS